MKGRNREHRETIPSQFSVMMRQMFPIHHSDANSDVARTFLSEMGTIPPIVLLYQRWATRHVPDPTGRVGKENFQKVWFWSARVDTEFGSARVEHMIQNQNHYMIAGMVTRQDTLDTESYHSMPAMLETKMDHRVWASMPWGEDLRIL